MKTNTSITSLAVATFAAASSFLGSVQFANANDPVSGKPTVRLVQASSKQNQFDSAFLKNTFENSPVLEATMTSMLKSGVAKIQPDQFQSLFLFAKSDALFTAGLDSISPANRKSFPLLTGTVSLFNDEVEGRKRVVLALKKGFKPDDQQQAVQDLNEVTANLNQLVTTANESKKDDFIRRAVAVIQADVQGSENVNSLLQTYHSTQRTFKNGFMLPTFLTKEQEKAARAPVIAATDKVLNSPAGREAVVNNLKGQISDIAAVKNLLFQSARPTYGLKS